MTTTLKTSWREGDPVLPDDLNDIAAQVNTVTGVASNATSHFAASTNPHGASLTQTTAIISKAIVPIATPTYAESMTLNAAGDSCFYIEADGALSLSVTGLSEIGRKATIIVLADSAVPSFGLSGVTWLGGAPLDIATGKVLVVTLLRVSNSKIIATWAAER